MVKGSGVVRGRGMESRVRGSQPSGMEMLYNYNRSDTDLDQSKALTCFR